MSSKEWRKRDKQINPEKYREYEFKRGLRRNYGMTVEQYDEIYVKQGGRCEICKRHQSEFKRRLAVDHCHSTGENRGLLCYECNPMLGYAKDDIKRLKSAIEYLNKFKK